MLTSRNGTGGLKLSYTEASVHRFNKLVKSGQIKLGVRDRQSGTGMDDIATAVAAKLQPMIVDALKPMVATLVRPMVTADLSTAITNSVQTALQSLLPGKLFVRYRSTQPMMN